MLGNESVSSVLRDAGLKGRTRVKRLHRFFENLNCRCGQDPAAVCQGAVRFAEVNLRVNFNPCSKPICSIKWPSDLSLIYE
jgi:hypothetical protein